MQVSFNTGIATQPAISARRLTDLKEG